MLPGLIAGTAERYAAVVLPGDLALEGQIIPVKILNADGNRLRGQQVK
jgi:tRNA A37 methylthiotransferase MiaB